MNEEEVNDLLTKSKQSIRASKSLLADDFSDFAASRAYYSMFYAIEALLLTEDLSFSKHSGRTHISFTGITYSHFKLYQRKRQIMIILLIEEL